jgi:translation initiation factor 4E
MNLSDTWTLWYTEQDLDKSSWNLTSYKKVKDINTVDDYWTMISEIPEHRWIDGMYFIMREGIQPTWEAPENKNGGSWCFRVPKIYAYFSWIELSMLLCGGTLMPKFSEEINGISISPKNNTVTIKIWNSNKAHSSGKEIPNILEFISPESVLYKANF